MFCVVAQMNLALGRPASQSSTYGLHIASKAVDGNAEYDNSSSITGPGDYRPWWKVELANTSFVTHVKLTNRKHSGEYGEVSGRHEFKLNTLRPELSGRRFVDDAFEHIPLEERDLILY